MHCTRAPVRTAILMVESAGVIPRATDAERPGRSAPPGPHGGLQSTIMAAVLPVAVAGLALAVSMPASLPKQARWRTAVPAPGVVDVVGPRADGRLVVATHSGLFLFRPKHALEPYARGPGGYVPPAGETYIALAPDQRLPSASCSFKRDDVFALDPATPGVTRIDRHGKASRFANLPAGSFPDGIAFDGVGRFGKRLLVTAVVGQVTKLYALDCRGRARVVVGDGPRVEGGIAVAPRGFGRFGGDLIAADEGSGRIFAFGSTGRVRLVAESGLPAGGDIGVEGVGFVPPRLGAHGAAYFSDMGAPGSPTQGTDSVLTLRGAELSRARLRAGELLAATESGAKTIAVRCARRCMVRRVAIGPAATHGEGHITFVPGE